MLDAGASHEPKPHHGACKIFDYGRASPIYTQGDHCMTPWPDWALTPSFLPDDFKPISESDQFAVDAYTQGPIFLKSSMMTKRPGKPAELSPSRLAAWPGAQAEAQLQGPVRS